MYLDVGVVFSPKPTFILKHYLRQKEIRKAAGCSVEHLCCPWMLCQNKNEVNKIGQNSGKCGLHLKNLASQCLCCKKQYKLSCLIKKGMAKL